MDKFLDKKLRIKFAGGREVVGVFKGQDSKSGNFVLDEMTEIRANGIERLFGLSFIKGSSVLSILSEEGFEEIKNPYEED